MSDRDWGSDTLARFRYQAEVTLPFCLSLLLSENDIRAVVPEHFEDIALQTSTGWRFLQVKSRDPERGLWTANDLLVKRGGALRSLYRTYRLTEGEDHSLELVLEGAVKTNDVIGMLRPRQDRSLLVPLVMEKLGASQSSAEDFLRRVTLNESAPSRSAIHATNALLLHVHVPTLTHPELEALHNSLLEEIERAMRCEPFGPFWPRAVAHPSNRSQITVERLHAKTLDANRLTRIAEPFSGKGRPLLKRFVESGSGPMSSLTQKLVVGGATDDLIEQARNLQANAHHQRFVRASQNLEDKVELLTDLHERLLAFAQSAGAIHESSSRPAIFMWGHMLENLHKHAGSIDRNNLVRADPMLLMGESCILSDQCEFNWGVTSDVAD